jgi:putative Mg2+ transporter-C (MgtC) family protein
MEDSSTGSDAACLGWEFALDVSDLLPNLSGLAFLPHVRDLSIAYGLAFLIGWNREREDRSAGLRTFPLVALASCGFVQATEAVLSGSPEGKARIIEGVITGIGFIGGGAILKGGGEVHGTATAASLWATGAIGVAVGLAAYDVALVLCLFTIVTLYVLSRIKPQEKQ